MHCYNFLPIKQVQFISSYYSALQKYSPTWYFSCFVASHVLFESLHHHILEYAYTFEDVLFLSFVVNNKKVKITEDLSVHNCSPPIISTMESHLLLQLQLAPSCHWDFCPFFKAKLLQLLHIGWLIFACEQRSSSLTTDSQLD
ncbi:hypothetical protein GOODEAATRI_027221 [Goodea atripinnis]|uniref:Maturase K n=1 Tax=Goodea atripinnis TaxID=208336 RepID=A0ABV0Q1H3_9TELE